MDCPSCHSQFPTLDSLTHHFNTQGAQCISALEDGFRIPTPPAFVHGAGETNVQGEFCKYSGYRFGKAGTLMDQLKADKHERHQEHQFYYLFSNEGEWDLVQFLVTLTKAQVSRFLKSRWFTTRAKPSFRTTEQLFGWLANLPTGPQWQATPINLNGYEPVQDVRLIWQDGLDVVKDLFSNLIFANYMTYDPHKVMCGTDHEYSEFFTGTRVFKIQAQLPVGSTIIPIIRTLDKMPVTCHTGGLEMHPLFLTIGNIQSDIRMQATSHAWHCIAFIPSPEFKVNCAFKSLLSARVFHWSLDNVSANLKAAALDGFNLTDPSGYQCNCYTPLGSYIADLPEQQLVSGVSRNASPVTLTEIAQFGDSTPATP
ncbi:hypothetical protein SCLCIDRAFT_27327 [Scleroderma citrinum Foug A]|uniref:Uncharacterized protein n=1 Tax=Scleroderma citrinum Foug A TaxID=1036808 RepID=A0A0C3DT26_9AGAM|nr:hypothetical protein SCLCIDRAFT_27327 [Scleroderma citrinum Foug A]